MAGRDQLLMNHPRPKSRPCRSLLWGLSALVVSLLVGCSATATQSVLSKAQVVGTWSNGHGSTISFYPNHQFAVVHMNTGDSRQGCGNVSGSGTWVFFGPQGDALPSDTEYSRGNEIALFFGSGSPCGADLTSWKTNSLGLCLDIDPDYPCTGTPWEKEK